MNETTLGGYQEAIFRSLLANRDKVDVSEHVARWTHVLDWMDM